MRVWYDNFYIEYNLYSSHNSGCLLSYTLINFYLDRGDKTSVKNLADEIIEEKKSTNDNLALLNTYIKLGREISRRYAFGSQFYEKALILAETIDVKEYLIDIYKKFQQFSFAICQVLNPLQ